MRTLARQAIWVSFAVVMLGGSVALDAYWQGANSAESSILGLDDIISAVKRELTAAQSVVIGEPRFQLTKVTVELNVAMVRSADGSVGLGVPDWGLGGEGGAGVERERSSTVTVELVPPRAEMLMEAESLDDLDIASTIVAVRRQLAAGLKQKPVLDPSKLSIDIRFGATRKLTGKAGIKLLFISFGGEGKTRTSRTHKRLMR